LQAAGIVHRPVPQLRPEGRQGPLVRSLAAYQSYYSRWAKVWEAQALLRARYVCGDADLAAEFVTVADPVRYPAGGLSRAQVTEIRRIKARVETERLPRGADPNTDTKLGRGGLADVEWAVQLLQLRHAGAVPAQLPLDIPGFLGRDEELDRLAAVLRAGAARPTAVTVCVLSGTAGVGKTTLAVHWAHRVRDRFPDGQLYVNLRGFDPTGTAVSSGDAVRAFLAALGVAPHRVPDDPSARTALYRSLLAGRRVLVVLDNARDAEQVRPLLPGSPDCLVLVTSRNQLTSLVAGEGAHPVRLDLLTDDDARGLLAARIGADRAA
ncbi:AAA family ATPase, partial [Micromonospora zhanjiangensis]